MSTPAQLHTDEFITLTIIYKEATEVAEADTIGIYVIQKQSKRLIHF